MCCLRVHELQRGGDSRFISLADSRVTIRGTALTARKLTALVHCQFRAPLGAAREESLRCWEWVAGNLEGGRASEWKDCQAFFLAVYFVSMQEGMYWHLMSFIHSDVYACHTNLQSRKHANYTINSHAFIFIPVDSQGCCHCYLKLGSAGTQSRTWHFLGMAPVRIKRKNDVSTCGNRRISRICCACRFLDICHCVNVLNPIFSSIGR